MKLRHFGFSALIVALSFPAWAADRPAVISGYVRDAAGTPQMGAVVQIAGAASRNLTVFTNGTGFFSATGLLPGIYSVKISAPSFLPAMLEKVGLRPGDDIHLRVTLNTLLNAVNIEPRVKAMDDDDWKWTLRSAVNRPVLRVFDDPASDVEQQNHELKASLSFLAGSAADGYGSGSDMSTGFSIERSIFATDRIGLSGNVAYGDGLPTAFLRASYAHRLMDGTGPSMALTVRRFAPSDPYLGNSTLQSVALNAADDVTVDDVVELKFGSQFDTIQFLGRVNAFRPYGSLNFHLSPNTILAYDYTTSLPNEQIENNLDNDSSDLRESDPRLSVENFATKVESAHHQELNVSQRIGKSNIQVAVFSDHVDNTALLGAGEVTAAGGYLLPDVYSGTFSYLGDRLDTRGFWLVLQRKFCSDLSATLDYAYGGALDLTKPDVELQQARQWMNTERRHAIAAKLSGNVPGTHTRVIASYRWLNGPALTPVDMFNASPGETDPFFSLVIRQPIPTLGFLPAHMEALIDLRNLLAEGYVPVMGRDGQTVYLVQAARAVRGGVAISF
ncbi:MAG: carboxypeptidase-like regulatory domain-containing protein [Candidatus Sulfotelmatobacter sp.]